LAGWRGIARAVAYDSTMESLADMLLERGAVSAADPDKAEQMRAELS